MNLPSRYLEKAVDQMSTLPGIGRKTALRLVLDLMNRKPQEIRDFSQAFIEMGEHLQLCKSCFNISDHELCAICSNKSRNQNLICVVRDIRDVMAIENTMQFKGLYHVLGGVISPMDGVGPNDLKIRELMDRINSESEEVILGLGATMEGDTTNFFLYKKLNELNVRVSILSRGVAVGDELEFADETTLGRSILNRLPFESTL